MQRFIISLVVCSTFLFCNSENLRSQGWPQKAGHGFYKLGVNIVSSDKFYEKSGEVLTIPTLSDYTVSLYGEYGITGGVTGILYLPVVKRITLNKQVGEPSGFVYFEGDEVTGVADADVGVRVQLFKTGSTVLTAGLKLGLPLGSDEQENGLYTGDGEFNQVLTIGAGHSFYPLPAYATGFLGVNNRTNGYSDEVHYGAELGYTVAEAVTVSGRLTGLESFRNGDGDVTGGMGGLFANDQRYLTYGAEVAWQMTEYVGLSAGITSAFFGRNTLSASEFSAGIFLKL